jgi:hypothetical protein
MFMWGYILPRDQPGNGQSIERGYRFVYAMFAQRDEPNRAADAVLSYWHYKIQMPLVITHERHAWRGIFFAWIERLTSLRRLHPATWHDLI